MWRLSARKRAELKNQQWVGHSFWLSGQLAFGWEIWRYNTAVVQELHGAATRAIAHSDNLNLKAAIFVWRFGSTSQVLHSRAQRGWKSILKHRVFKRWRGSSAIGSRNDTLLRRAVAKMYHSKALQALATMRDAARAVAGGKQSGMEAMRQWQGGGKLRAFRQWRMEAAAGVHAEGMVNEALFNMKDALKNKVHRYFSFWRTGDDAS